jgi:hypothetical protein
MKGDFSRDTFSPHRHYNAVLMQQGRVQLDADWNEQRAIDRHRTETEARDLIGPGGAQVGNAGFEIGVHDKKTLSIGSGNLYVDGILCQNEEPENGEPLLFENQIDLPGPQVIDILKGDPEVGLVYLDVWERHVTALDDGHIREVALRGPDTATRSRIVWQARVLPVRADTSKIAALQPLLEKHLEIASKLEDSSGNEADDLRFTLARTDNRILELLGVDCESPFEDEMKEANPPSTGRLAAQALPPASTDSRCAVPPSAGYERLENQLYRVEIHQGSGRGVPTFKWSRDNGSVQTAVVGVTPKAPVTEIVVRDLGRDENLGFANGQYVELMDDSRELAGQAGPLVQISSINPTTHTIVVDGVLADVGIEDARGFHYKLRCWDSEGALEVPDSDEFVELEGGVEVQFSPDHYNTGDYWLIPARTATGKIEWPYDEVRENGQVLQRPLHQPPAGIKHHYSRLALVMAATVNEERQLLVLSDCRRLFPPLTELTSLFYLGGDGQEAGSGQPLPKPLVVGVANGDRPVLGAQVMFEVQAEDLGSYDGELEADGNAGTIVVATTNARGEAQCSWRLATDRPSQQIRASLLNGTHLPVYFNANLSAASEAVAESIQITRVLLANEQDLRADSNVPVNTLVEGIQVVCDDETIVDEQTVRERPTCFVTLEMPFPQREDDPELWGEALIGFRPLILAAELQAEKNVILWRPAELTGAWLRDRLFQKLRGTERILARLTLKGNFIWDDERPDAYLDGEVFGIRRSSGAEIDLRLPSGDGRRGGDFETWFWLVSQTLTLDSVTLDRDRVTGGTQAMRGTVRILGTAPANGASVKLESSNPGVVSVPGSVRIEAGGSSASFEVGTVAVRTDTPVTITATLETQQETMQKSVGLVVQSPVLDAVSVNPSTVTGRTTPVQGTVTLTGPAPAGGIEVQLNSGNPDIVKIQQSTVTVPAGRNTAGFTVNTEPVNGPTPVAVIASSQNVQKTTPLTVVPPALTQITLNPTSVLGGGTSQGTVQLGGPAAASFTVDLRSTNTSLATVQSSVTVPANSTSATFVVNARPVVSTSQVNIVASRSGVDRVATLTVQSPVPVGFTFSPQTIDGGDTSTGTITLNGPAPSGTSVALSPTSNAAAIFPGSVSVQSNATRASFTATGRTFIGLPRSVTVTASYSSGGSRSASLTVLGREPDPEPEPKDETDFASFEMLAAESPRSTGGPAATDEDTEHDSDEAPASARPFIERDELPRVGGPTAKPINEQPK